MTPPDPPPAQVALHTPATIYAPRHLPSWLLLAAAAGFVNGFAFLQCQQFVTHVTGTATRLGLEWPQAGVAAEYAAVLLAFIAGGAVAAVVVQWRARRAKADRWVTPLFAIAALLAGVGVAGQAGLYGPFGGVLTTDPQPLLLMALLAFAAGAQNAAVASTTGMSVRTTHFTGPATDIGLLVGASVFCSAAERGPLLRGAALRAGMLLAFVAGAGLALPVAGAVGFLALLVPSGCVAVAGGLSFVPGWGVNDFPFHRPDLKDPPPGPFAGLPADARPADTK